MASPDDIREALAASLRDSGLRVYPYVPANISPPCVAIQPAEGVYLEPGETFGSDWVINLSVFLIVKSGTNETMLRDLDRKLADLAPHFEDSITNEPWTVEVSAPITWTVNNQDYVGCRIAASNHFDLG